MYNWTQIRDQEQILQNSQNFSSYHTSHDSLLWSHWPSPTLPTVLICLHMVPWNFYIHILDCCTKTLIVCSSFEPRSETRVVLTYLRWSHLCVCVCCVDVWVEGRKITTHKHTAQQLVKQKSEWRCVADWSYIVYC